MTGPRISVFIDGANFFYMQKDRLHWWIDPKKLLNWIRKRGDVVDAYYYVGVDQNADPQQDNFLKALTYMGYCLVTKELKTVTLPDGTDKRKANLDIEIVLDMFNTIDHYDMAVLLSGDADFERPLQLLRARGKKFLVMSTQGFVAREIRAVAGMHFMDFQEIREHVEKQQVYQQQQQQQQGPGSGQ
ncbi:MAG TPA: NYN domain-containing protein [Planctomycetia bacterium]|nr:NYN domain-containing protein [Planctomycetia bacterium]